MKLSINHMIQQFQSVFISLHRLLYQNIHSNFIQNSQELEKAQVSNR